MLKGTDLIGLPVIASDSGETLRQIQDFIISNEQDRLIGFLIDKGGWTGRAQVVPWSEVLSTGPGAIIVRSRGSIVDAHERPELQHVLENSFRLRGTRMCTTDGVDLGVIMDLYFSRQTGETVGYEVCGRLLEEATSHCAFISISYHPRVEGTTAWVPPQVVDVVKRQIESVRRIKLPGSQSRSAAALEKQLHDPERHSVRDVRDSALVSLGEMARGRQLLWDIRSAEGWLIAARGQPVTEAVLQRALAHNRLRELLRAADVTWTDRRDPN